MTLTDLWQTCNALLPELVLTVAICAIVLADMFIPLRKSRLVCGALALLGVLWALWLVAARLLPANPLLPFRARGDLGDMISGDNLSLLLRLLFLGATGATILFSLRSRELAGYRHGEYFALLLGAVLGAGLLVASRNFIMFVLSLETMSMCSYVLAGAIKHERPSSEAGLKYLLYGAVASGVMIFGISYLYGLTGTLEIGGTIQKIGTMVDWAGRPMVSAGFFQQMLPFLLALLLVLAGLGFKIAMVPFQFWAPDVYQGAPTPVTAFLSVVSKIAGFSALLRLLLPLFQPLEAQLAGLLRLPILFGVLAVLTMTFGNLVALRQTDIKRLLGYSSIAHAGYLLMGLAAFNADALRAILAYFFIYLFMNLGAFWIVTILVSRLGGAELERFRGARLKAPFLFWVMFIFLISLTGLPPTAGFTGKLMLFGAVVNRGLAAMAGGTITSVAWGWFALALVGVINSAISLAYYMKIAKVMAFDVPVDEAPIKLDWFDRALALAFAVPTLVLLNFAPVLALVDRAL